VATPADLLLVLITTAGFVLSLWLGVGTALSALAQLPGAFGQACARFAAWIAPAALRRGTALVVGTAIAAAVAPGTAVATASAPARQSVATRLLDSSSTAASDLPDPAMRPPGPVAVDPVPDPGFQAVAPPSPPVEATLGPLDTRSRTGGPAEERYVVRRGDTLWDIASRHLGPRASSATVAREWPRWYAANRAVIGTDPHHIEPGQRLLPPEPSTNGADR
jgi:nucleoid-associated protein YgaU